MSLEYSTDPRWADLTPIPQNDGENPVVSIAYSHAFTETMNYFRAILAADERSRRALELTEDVIEQNNANYTAWHFRRLCLTALGADLKKELEFIENMAINTPKNYQLWYHRRLIVTDIAASESNHRALAKNETIFVSQVLLGDAKNYHAWSHRQWVCGTFDYWVDELAYVDELLTTDIRNNSAWNHRMFVITKNKTVDLTPSLITDEVKFTIASLLRVPHNESAWNYLSALTNFTSCTPETIIELEKVCVHILSKNNRCWHALAFLADRWEKSTDTTMKNKAAEAYDLLANHLDKTRQKYWLWRKNEHL